MNQSYKPATQAFHHTLLLIMPRMSLILSPYEALQTATINAARHVGLESVLGSLEPGKHADLVVFKMSPLEHILSIQSPKMVFKEGNLKFNK